MREGTAGTAGSGDGDGASESESESERIPPAKATQTGMHSAPDEVSKRHTMNDTKQLSKCFMHGMYVQTVCSQARGY